ncbi:MAG: hypothetical protein KAJ14_15130, partial [Candidatus Omnitrophica bacterium]|nr:hypothetical protein [Candidatus Omnitrophota bacterium]
MQELQEGPYSDYKLYRAIKRFGLDISRKERKPELTDEKIIMALKKAGGGISKASKILLNDWNIKITPQGLSPRIKVIYEKNPGLEEEIEFKKQLETILRNWEFVAYPVAFNVDELHRALNPNMSRKHLRDKLRSLENRGLIVLETPLEGKRIKVCWTEKGLVLLHDLMQGHLTLEKAWKYDLLKHVRIEGLEEIDVNVENILSNFNAVAGKILFTKQQLESALGIRTLKELGELKTMEKLGLVKVSKKTNETGFIVEWQEKGRGFVRVFSEVVPPGIDELWASNASRWVKVGDEEIQLSIDTPCISSDEFLDALSILESGYEKLETIVQGMERKGFIKERWWTREKYMLVGAEYLGMLKINIADYLDMSRNSMSRYIKDLTDEGLIAPTKELVEWIIRGEEITAEKVKEWGLVLVSEEVEGRWNDADIGAIAANYQKTKYLFAFTEKQLKLALLSPSGRLGRVRRDLEAMADSGLIKFKKESYSKPTKVILQSNMKAVVGILRDRPLRLEELWIYGIHRWVKIEGSEGLCPERILNNFKAITKESVFFQFTEEELSFSLGFGKLKRSVRNTFSGMEGLGLVEIQGGESGRKTKIVWTEKGKQVLGLLDKGQSEIEDFKKLGVLKFKEPTKKKITGKKVNKQIETDKNADKTPRKYPGNNKIRGESKQQAKSGKKKDFESTLSKIHEIALEKGILLSEKVRLKHIIWEQKTNGTFDGLESELYSLYEARYAGERTIYDKLRDFGFKIIVIDDVKGVDDPYAAAVELTLFNVYNAAGEEGILIDEQSRLKAIIRNQMRKGVSGELVDELYSEYK